LNPGAIKAVADVVDVQTLLIAGAGMISLSRR
jgi:hypothetical protein